MPTPLSNENVAELRRKCKKISGEWSYLCDREVEAVWIVQNGPPVALLDYMTKEQNVAIAEFIVAARESMLPLIEEVIHLRQHVTKLVEANNMELNARIELQKELEKITSSSKQ